MSHQKIGAVILGVATLALAYVEFSTSSSVIGLILVVLWFVLLGYLVGCFLKGIGPFRSGSICSISRYPLRALRHASLSRWPFSSCGMIDQRSS